MIGKILNMSCIALQENTCVFSIVLISISQFMICAIIFTRNLRSVSGTLRLLAIFDPLNAKENKVYTKWLLFNNCQIRIKKK